MRHRRHGRRVRADASSESSGVRFPFARPRDLVELPLFPLPLVLFPGQVLPLKIFEYRYRIMTHTLLQTDLRFGVVYANEVTGTAAAIGCVAEVLKHEKHPEDRFTLVCKGQQRFRVHEIVRTKPYLVARVEWLEDRPSAEPAPGEDAETLAREVEGLMKDVIRLSNKVSGKQNKKDKEGDDLRKQAFPTPFSFWVASTFEGAPAEQQALLELTDTTERLKREQSTLRNTLNYLTAATAVKDVFRSSSSKDTPEDFPSEEPPVGGPD
ncbi:Putative E3 ubiquitin ligase [Klebsormidium nitens]|uniref:Putative E3 ubiquitin ligase n=1 Tax=Klebsormidium nitens TaxID=105231 RepID=A0A1Y1IUF3_KLENI|nr:Putative E3 ubiquitin ligase [Klebsormidium nitens]|eukprot:GAQ92466.1 Putative E3 ubiquitin ligase [Klebsormidium nitens]